MHISHRDVSEKNKKRLYPQEDFITTRRCCEKGLDVASAKCVKIRKARDVALFAGTHTDPQAGLGAPFLGCAHVELPLPLFVRSTQAAPPPPLLFLTASVPPKNTFLDNHKPSIPFPDPTEMHTFVLKPCFSTINCRERIAVFARFLSSIHEEERTNADVNTGNDSEKREKIENKAKLLA